MVARSKIPTGRTREDEKLEQGRDRVTGTTEGFAMEEFPPLVVRAQAVAREVGFRLTRQDAGQPGGSASLPGVGRFLAVLAAGCTGGRIGELGTGSGSAPRGW